MYHHKCNCEARYYLLETFLLVGDYVEYLVVYVYDSLVHSNLENAVPECEETVAYLVVHEASVEADPMVVPTGGGVGGKGVPLAWKENEYHSGFNLCS